MIKCVVDLVPDVPRLYCVIRKKDKKECRIAQRPCNLIRPLIAGIDPLVVPYAIIFLVQSAEQGEHYVAIFMRVTHEHIRIRPFIRVTGQFHAYCCHSSLSPHRPAGPLLATDKKFKLRWTLRRIFVMSNMLTLHSRLRPISPLDIMTNFAFQEKRSNSLQHNSV